MKKIYVVFGTIMAIGSGMQFGYAVIEMLKNFSFLGISSAITGAFCFSVAVKLIKDEPEL